MTNKEKAIELINAYFDDTKQILVKDKDGGIFGWVPQEDLHWTYLIKFIEKIDCYKIVNNKSEITIRPYNNAKEFLEGQKEHGPYLNYNGIYSIPTEVSDDGVDVAHIGYGYKSLLIDYKWQDGTAVGVLEE